MGAGGDIPHALKPLRTLLLLFACTWSAACWDFLEPDLPANGGAAVLQVTAFVRGGSAFIDALLAPGLDQDGFTREVVRDTLGVFSVRIPPEARRANGSLTYRFHESSTTLGSEPFAVDPPVLRDVRDRPAVRWSGFRRIGPDTIRASRGSSVVFRSAVDDITGQTDVPQQQWYFDLVGQQNRFQLGGSGPPPNEITVPASFIPAAPDTLVRAVLSFVQSGQPRRAGYIGIYNYTVQIEWTLIVR